jgi:hypothetical protein
MNPGGRGLRRAPGDEMASCKGRGSKTVCKALLYSADGGRAIALATAAATGSMPALMGAVFGETRVSARVAHQKTLLR